jgi:hypothetical protein
MEKSKLARAQTARIISEELDKVPIKQPRPPVAKKQPVVVSKPVSLKR